MCAEDAWPLRRLTVASTRATSFRSEPGRDVMLGVGTAPCMKWMLVTVLAVSFFGEALAFCLPHWALFSSCSQSLFSLRQRALDRTGLKARMTIMPALLQELLRNQDRTHWRKQM